MTAAVFRLVLESLYDEHNRKALRLERVGSGTENRIAADALRWALDQVTEPNRDGLWVARCGVCNAGWTAEGEHNPYPHGTFCPDCRAQGRMAPGVLNWQRGDTSDRQPSPREDH